MCSSHALPVVNRVRVAAQTNASPCSVRCTKQLESGTACASSKRSFTVIYIALTYKAGLWLRLRVLRQRRGGFAAAASHVWRCDADGGLPHAGLAATHDAAWVSDGYGRRHGARCGRTRGAEVEGASFCGHSARRERIFRRLFAAQLHHTPRGRRAAVGHGASTCCLADSE